MHEQGIGRGYVECEQMNEYVCMCMYVMIRPKVYTQFNFSGRFINFESGASKSITIQRELINIELDIDKDKKG